jgi:hypothetical protein
MVDLDLFGSNCGWCGLRMISPMECVRLTWRDGLYVVMALFIIADETLNTMY